MLQTESAAKGGMGKACPSHALMAQPIILATWEAAIRKITVQSQLRQIVQETLS
jgi:hypothetical protein